MLFEIVPQFPTSTSKPDQQTIYGLICDTPSVAYIGSVCVREVIVKMNRCRLQHIKDCPLLDLRRRIDAIKFDPCDLCRGPECFQKVYVVAVHDPVKRIAPGVTVVTIPIVPLDIQAVPAFAAMLVFMCTPPAAIEFAGLAYQVMDVDVNLDLLGV
ncbi:MAG: hypothetical protein C5S52_00100 [ANME-2 cluster archaeon]|nr:hypothetical protein [ANME-2 cluster archaeon]